MRYKLANRSDTLKNMKKIGQLEIVSFSTGASLMAYELVAARVLAPTIGSSTYVWTAVIGVIIAALSVGYYAGGKLADFRGKSIDVAWLLLWSALLVALTRILYLPAIDWLSGIAIDIRLQAIAIALVLFAPTSFLLGVISPYLVKLQVTSLKKSGQAVASLSTSNAIGSIAGTFATGFILFGYVGSRETLSLIAVLLVLVSWLINTKFASVKRLIVGGIVVLIAWLPVLGGTGISIDTPSAHYMLTSQVRNGRPITGLITGPGGTQSAVYQMGNNELVFWYTSQMARTTLELKPQKILILGGGAFTLPNYLGATLPQSRIDVVEIDPVLEEIAVKHFRYSSPPNVRLIFDDARAFLEKNTEQYDVVLVDVYGDDSIPFSLITTEYVRSLERAVSPNGVVLANIIAGFDGGACEELLGSLQAAYGSVFSHAYYRAANPHIKRGNIIAAYSRNEQQLATMAPLTTSRGQLFHDNYAPGERLYFNCRNQSQS